MSVDGSLKTPAQAVEAEPWRETLAPDEAALVRSVAHDLVAGGTLIDDPSWVDRARDAWLGLPRRLQGAVRAFRRGSGVSGALLIRGVPVDPEAMPPTPRQEGSVQRTPSVPAAVLTMVSSGLGDPVAYAEEKSGALVQDVVPVPGQEEFVGNAGSSLLDFHTENAFHPHRPDYVMLLCLRPDHDRRAALRVGSIRRVSPLLPAPLRRTLSTPGFVTSAPPSFGAAAGGGAAPRHAVLDGAIDDPQLRVDFAATQATTHEGRQALQQLARLFDTTATSLWLEPGDLVIVDNRAAAHGRTPFRPRYDQRDRWLQRSFAVADLRRSRAHRPGDGYVLHLGDT
jgi:L-asparagine oxygenase